MPFRSKAQSRWMFANRPKDARKWASETNYSSIPERTTSKSSTRKSHSRSSSRKSSR